MIPSGLKASEVILILQALIAHHGDRPCFSGGTDYPEGVSNVSFKAKGDGYYADKCFVIG